METTNIENKEQTAENGEIQEKTKKDKTLLIKKILFAVIGVLILFLIILTLLFIFKGDSEEPKDETLVSTEKPIENNSNSVENITQEPEIVEKKFDFNNLEPEKLNEQLELFTNKNLEQQKEKEQKLLEEEKKLSPVFNLVNNLKDKEGIKKEENSIVSSEDNKKEEISKIEEIKEDKKEEIISEKKDVATSTSNETKTQNETSNINSNSKKEETTKITESLTFVKLINVAKIKGDLNKKYFDKVIEVNANVLLCRDDENIIELYYGPFLEDEIRDNLLSKLIKNGFKEAYSLEMTKEEFDKRCNY